MRILALYAYIHRIHIHITTYPSSVVYNWSRPDNRHFPFNRHNYRRRVNTAYHQECAPNVREHILISEKMPQEEDVLRKIWSNLMAMMRTRFEWIEYIYIYISAQNKTNKKTHHNKKIERLLLRVQQTQSGMDITIRLNRTTVCHIVHWWWTVICVQSLMFATGIIIIGYDLNLRISRCV